MKAINCWVITVARYIMNACNLGKGGFGELDMIVKTVLRIEGLHGRQSSDERLNPKKSRR